MNNRIINFLEKINKTSLYAAILLIPMFFLVFSEDFLEQPKHILLMLLLIVCLSSWFLKQLFLGEIIIKKHFGFYLIMAMLFLAATISSIFSLSKNGSFWGWPLNIGDSLVSIIFFLALSFILANSFNNKKDFLFLLKLLVVSAAVIALFTVFQIYNVFILPFEFAKTPFFNLMGAISSVALLAAIMLPISLCFCFSDKKYWRAVFLGALFIFLLTLFLINFRVAWAILSLSTVLLMIFGIKANKQINFAWIGALMVLLVMSVFFLFFPLRLEFLPAVATEVSPNLATEIKILQDSFKESTRNIFIGTGPGTFLFNYSKFRPPIINQTIFWGNRFIRGNSVVFDRMITQGMFGGLALLTLMVWAACVCVKKIIKYSQELEDLNPQIAFFISAIGILIASFFYSFNFVLWFIFWTYIGIILFYASKEKKIDLKSVPHKTGMFVLICALTLVAGASAFIFQITRYSADAKYAKAMEKAQENKIEESIALLEKAVSINPNGDVYWRELAQLYLIKADIVSRNASLGEEERQQLTHNAVARGADAVNMTISVFPENVANWNVRGYFYRNLIPIQGADELALESYRRAIALEPSSPFSYTEMARVYILIAQEAERKDMDSKKEEALSLAIQKLNQAIELKRDYSPAHYLLAVVYDQQGKIEEAILKLREAQAASPRDVGVAFQLGLLYWRQERLEQAEKEFKVAIELMPNYLNARYMLGLVYNKQGKKQEAFEQFKIIDQLNPNNQEIKQILEDLEKNILSPGAPEVIENIFDEFGSNSGELEK